MDNLSKVLSVSLISSLILISFVMGVGFGVGERTDNDREHMLSFRTDSTGILMNHSTYSHLFNISFGSLPQINESEQYFIIYTTIVVDTEFVRLYNISVRFYEWYTYNGQEVTFDGLLMRYSLVARSGQLSVLYPQTGIYYTLANITTNYISISVFGRSPEIYDSIFFVGSPTLEVFLQEVEV